MKKLFTFFLALIASVGTIFAQSGTCGENLTWNLTDGVLTISGTGEMNNYGYGEDLAPWFFYYSGSITSIVINSGVTSIGDMAFYLCENFTSVTIPNSINRIGKSAFLGCTALTSMTIPNSVTSIGDRAFSECTGLTSVEIPNSVTSIEGGTFYMCTSLTSVTIPNSVISIGYYAFLGCTALTSMTIPNGVTSIGSGAFYGCTGLISITIPNSVTSIEDEVFYNCSELIGIYATCGDLDRLKQLLNNDSRVKYPPLPYSLTTIAEHGDISSNINELTVCDDGVLICTANPEEGYHFVQWMDGYTVNPRSVKLTQDTTMEAMFAINKYSITVSCDSLHGSIEGENGEFNYLSELTYTAVPVYGYHFYQWSDGNTQNPRTIVLTQDTALEAIFAINIYTMNVRSNYTNRGSVSGSGSYSHSSSCVITATPNNGYHFTQWSDGNTDNPRTIIMTQDVTLVAIFDRNTYNVDVHINDSEMGTVSGAGSYEHGSECMLTAAPNYGYHFVKWLMPKPTDAITVSQAYSIAAGLAAGASTNQKYNIVGYVTGKYGNYTNSYYLSDSPDVAGKFIAFKCESSANIGDLVKVRGYLTNYKGNTPETTSGSSIELCNPIDNPLYIDVYENMDITAVFAKNTYNAKVIFDDTKGEVTGAGSYEYLEAVDFTVTPNYGYHFVRWSDGNTDNPRTIIMTQDTTMTAEFAIDKYGTCGANNALSWSWDDQSKTLTITGKGALTENYTFGLEAPTQMNTLIIGDEVSEIGERAFYNTKTLNHLFIGANVASIGSNTFAECRNFDDITCYASIVPTINATTFANVGNKQYIYLFVPEDRERAYKRDEFWGEFDIRIKGTDETVTDTKSVTVEPADNTAIFTWPIDNDAASYSLQITKDGEVFCTLNFNSNGQLIGIAFAPSRNGAAHAQAATMSISAMSFTVTGLNTASKYAYRLSVTDESQNEIQAYSGEFATTGYEGEINHGGEPEINPEGIEDVLSTEKAHKILLNGQILILRGDRTYTLTGQEVK